MRSWRAPLAPLDIHDVDRPGQALEGRASLIRRPARLAHRREAGDDVAPAAELRDPRSLVDAPAVEVTAHPGRVGGVEPDPDLRREPLGHAMLSEPPLDGDRGRHRQIRRVEAHEEAVARRRDLLALVGQEHLAEGRVVPREQRLPGLVTEGHDQVRRADDVGEHQGLHDPARGTGLATKLPWQELGDVLEDHRGRRARERGRPEDVLVDGVGTHDLGLAVVAGEPVEDRRRERDAVAGADALVAVDARADGHQRDPTAASPRKASEVASARLDAPSCACRRASRRPTSASSTPSWAAISAFVWPSVRSWSSRRSSWTSPPDASDPATSPTTSGPWPSPATPASSTSCRPTGPVSHRTRIASSAVPWAIRESNDWR